jgi:transcription-repair coupling factor (superfamily II helicase)
MSVANLLDIAYIKALLHPRGVTKVSQRKGNVIINFKADAKVDVTELMKSIQSMNNRLMFTANEAGGYLTYKIQKEKEVLKELKELAEMIK